MGEPSRLYKLIEERLDGTLADLIAKRRPHTPWHAIADEITETTRIDVSKEILRQWFADRISIEVKVS